MTTSASKKSKILFISGVISVALLSAVSIAQIKAPGFSTKPMLVSAINDAQEIAIINVSMAPGSASPAHKHPGNCYGAVLDGTVELFVDGKSKGVYSAGQAWENPRGPAHYFKNVGNTPARLVNTLIVDKGKKRTVVQK
ncbi:MAG: cupin domain-containing protein [Candidatus Sedimenticola sp. (ex Thyasira tokunagai)]